MEKSSGKKIFYFVLSLELFSVVEQLYYVEQAAIVY